MPRATSFLLLLALCACSPSAPPARTEPSGPPAQRAFYFWRTELRLSEAELATLRELRVARLYLRVFDVVWESDGVKVVGPLTAPAGQPRPPGVELVPVVFLREEILRRTPPRELNSLAGWLWQQVELRARELALTPGELQLDCDWTDRSRDAYFALLERLRALAKVPITATIRLHQVKYRERTGVPPVARGMLMYYNMGRFSADPEARAIFDSASAARYLSRVSTYPLPLDVALPIWSWTLHLRGERVLDVLQSVGPEDLAQASMLEVVDEGRYRVRESGFLRGALLRQGDELKVEVTDARAAAEAAAQLTPHLAPTATARTVALFDLSERNLRRHDPKSLDKLFDRVR
ncbi:MAG: hypothetical protein R3B48_25580 [Kofleriaceae bacterium]